MSPPNSAPGWYEVPAQKDRELLAFVSIISNSVFENGRGLGTHVLDLSWLVGPKPEMQVLIPKEQPKCAKGE